MVHARASISGRRGIVASPMVVVHVLSRRSVDVADVMTTLS